MKVKVAILYLCTGEYSIFWKLFYYTFKRHFLKSSDVHYFVFSDNRNLDFMDNRDVHFIYSEKLDWPYSTLFRFHTFLKVEEDIRKYDYCFFFNANMICVKDIYENDFLPYKNDLLVVEHPGHFRTKLENWNWERNMNSKAYIRPGAEKVYVCGGVNGGRARAFMDMAVELKNRINEDLENNIIACVHDESHINKYILDFPDYRLLDSEYAYPEGWNIPVEQKMLLLTKARLFNVSKIKNDKNVDIVKSYNFEKAAGRMEQYFEVTKQILYCKNRGIEIEEYLLENGLKSIAIFGYRNMGQVLLDELKDKRVEIKCIIDNNVDIPKGELNIIRGDEITKELQVDCIVVSALYSFYNIYEKLIEKVDCPIYSLEFLVHNMYMSCCMRERES